MVTARFDDLTPGAEFAFELRGPGPVVSASRPSDVAEVLRTVEQLSRAGWWLAGFVSYEAAPGLDAGLVVRPADDDAPPPLAWFAAFRERVEREPVHLGANGEYTLAPFVHEMEEPDHAAAVAAIRGHIAAGDTYQVNLTYRMRSRLSGSVDAFYRDLVLAQRGGYGAFLDTGDVAVVSASPERFFTLEGSSIVVQPMKGTMRRGRWPEEDDALRRRLAASAKDAAENVMIVDLLRNDVGRIAEFGSVSVDRLLEIERYETVWQLTSQVSGRVREDVGLVDVFRALFPSGSVTGAPKQRTMEIISDLERSARGVYCGAVGYVAPSATDLNAGFSVAIRTAVVEAATGKVGYGVGGGITWDSEAADEYAEAVLKADVLGAPARPSGLFETVRWTGEVYHLLDRHRDRLGASAAYFGLSLDLDALDGALHAAVAGVTTPKVVRVTLHRDGKVTTAVRDAARWHEPGDEAAPVALAISDDPVSSWDVQLFHKTADRRRYERRLAAHPEVDDVVLVNERGEATETTIANLAVDLGGEWVTPPLSSGCLPGTYREALIDRGTISERVVTVEALQAADGIAVINSVRGWRPAVVVDGS